MIWHKNVDVENAKFFICALLPMRLAHLSDEEEIAIGNELAGQYSIGSVQFGLLLQSPSRYQYSALSLHASI